VLLLSLLVGHLSGSDCNRTVGVIMALFKVRVTLLSFTAPVSKLFEKKIFFWRKGKLSLCTPWRHTEEWSHNSRHPWCWNSREVTGQFQTSTDLPWGEESPVTIHFLLLSTVCFVEWKIVWHDSLYLFNVQTARAKNGKKNSYSDTFGITFYVIY
jgi:hypothetical protein